MSRPLAGRRFLVTRRPQQAGGLVALLRDAGAEVIEAPAITIAPPEDPREIGNALARLHEYDWIVFTSANAVGAVAELGAPRGGRSPLVASIGPATTRAIQESFARAPDLVPESDYRAEGLAAALVARGVSGARILLPLSDRARDTLETRLRAAGARVDRVVAYRTLPAPGAAESIAHALGQGFDLVLFASPSAVESFAAVAGHRTLGLPAGVIGPVTREAAQDAGLVVRAVAEPSTAQGLVVALVRLFT